MAELDLDAKTMNRLLVADIHRLEAELAMVQRERTDYYERAIFAEAQLEREVATRKSWRK